MKEIFMYNDDAKKLNHNKQRRKAMKTISIVMLVVLIVCIGAGIVAYASFRSSLLMPVTPENIMMQVKLEEAVAKNPNKEVRVVFSFNELIPAREVVDLLAPYDVEAIMLYHGYAAKEANHSGGAGVKPGEDLESAVDRLEKFKPKALRDEIDRSKHLQKENEWDTVDELEEDLAHTTKYGVLLFGIELQGTASELMRIQNETGIVAKSDVVPVYAIVNNKWITPVFPGEGR